MRRYRVRQYLAGSDEELQVLLDADGIPCYYPNLFATVNLRQRERSTATILQNLRSIRMTMDWFHAKNGIDFNDRIFNGDPLLFKEAKPLADFLKMTVKHQDLTLKALHESKKRNEEDPGILSLESVKPKRGACSNSFPETNARATVSDYIHCVCNYLDWAYKLRSRPPLIENFNAERQALAEDGLAQLRAQIPRLRNRNNEDERLWSIPEDVVELIESIIKPDSRSNPWNDAFLRDRNFVLWKVYFDTGGRRDEVRNIMVDDLNLNIRCVTFRVSKTIPRTVPLTLGTCMLIKQFLMEHWQHLPVAARQTGYLFTNRQGHQLTVRGVNFLFETIRKCESGIPDWLTPHTLRRTWNVNFSKMIDEQPEGKRWSSEMEVEVRNRLMGWSPGSQSASTYLGRHLDEAGTRAVNMMLEGNEPVDGAEIGGGHE